MRMFKLGLGVALALAFGSQASAQETYSQENGLLCKPWNGQFGDFARNERGIKNNATSSRRVFCPLVPPAIDSEISFPTSLKSLQVFVNQSGSKPNCWIYSMTKSGATTWSAPGTLEQDSFWLVWSIKFPAVPAVSGTVSLGYVCDMPAASSIHGALSRYGLGRIHGGI